MERQQVLKEKSSQIRSIGYDHDTKILELEFSSGGVYAYFDVPQALYDEFIRAESLGSFVATRIRGVFRYARMHAESCFGAACEVKDCPCWHHKLTKTSRETEKASEEKKAKPASKKKLRPGI
jgi:hypothetical protein